jgi:hypothetical protein
MILRQVGKRYLPDCYPYELKGDTLEYFIYGEGWKKTKKFKDEQYVSIIESLTVKGYSHTL